MTARRVAAPTPCPHYVPMLHGYARVTLIAPIEDVQTGWIFLGDYEGEPVRVWVSGVDTLRVRRTIRDHGSAVYDSPGAYVHDARPEDLRAADPAPIPLSEEERVRIAKLRILRMSGYFE